jgi:hypothetical protein
MRLACVLLLVLAGGAFAQDVRNAAAESAKKRIEKLDLFAPVKRKIYLVRSPQTACAVPLTKALRPGDGESRTPVLKTPEGRPGDAIAGLPACDDRR